MKGFSAHNRDAQNAAEARYAGAARFLDISIKSANETEYHLLASHDLALISDADWEKYTTETIEVRKMTYAYRAAILRDEGGPEHAAPATDDPQPR